MTEPLLPGGSINDRSTRSMNEFRSYLWWANLEVTYLIFGIIVPCWFTYDAALSRPFQKIIELSLSSCAFLSFFWLGDRPNLHKVLLMDDIVVDDTDVVPRKYNSLFNIALKRILPSHVLPIFVAKCALKIWWWHVHAASVDPFSWGNIFDLASWLYRTTMFFFLCIFIGHTQNVQKLRISKFSKYFFKANWDSKRVLKDYFRIFKDLHSTNNCFSPFPAYSLAIFTALTVYGLSYRVELSETSTSINLELFLCSLTIALGINIMLYSAMDLSIVTKMIASDASRWYASQPFSNADGCMLLEERKAIVNCFAANPCCVAISGMKVEEIWIRSIQWTMWVMTFALLWACLNAAN